MEQAQTVVPRLEVTYYYNYRSKAKNAPAIDREPAPYRASLMLVYHLEDHVRASQVQDFPIPVKRCLTEEEALALISPRVKEIVGQLKLPVFVRGADLKLVELAL